MKSGEFNIGANSNGTGPNTSGGTITLNDNAYLQLNAWLSVGLYSGAIPATSR